MLAAPADTSLDPTVDLARRRVAPLSGLLPGAPPTTAPNIAPTTPPLSTLTSTLPPPQRPLPTGLAITPTTPPPVPNAGPTAAQAASMLASAPVTSQQGLTNGQLAARPNVGPTAPPPAGGPITEFGPGNDLRFSQINPADDARTRRLSDFVDTAAGKVNNSPDLAQAGLDRLAELRQGLSEDRRKGIQDIGRGAAAFGRLGSGVTTSQLGDLESSLQARELAAEKGLAGDLTVQEAADRRANAGTLAGLQDQLFGQGAQRRNEVRGERGYQTGVAETATDRAIQQRMIEEELKNSQFGRNATAAQLGLGAANQYDASAQDASGSAADLASSVAMYNARGLTPGATPTPTTPAPSGYQWVGGRLVPIRAGAQTF